MKVYVSNEDVDNRAYAKQFAEHHKQPDTVKKNDGNNNLVRYLLAALLMGLTLFNWLELVSGLPTSVVFMIYMAVQKIREIKAFEKKMMVF